MAATRNVALNELNFRGISINAATNTITIVPSDSGIIFINKNTANSTNYNLPAVADSAGKMFWFFNGQTTQNLLITAPTSTMIGDDSVTANTMTTAANNAGAGAFAVCDGSYWYMFDVGSSAWTVAT